jgi:hypothetical protein
MGSKVSVPGPSAEERALQRNQAELLALQRSIIEAQQRQNAVLLPFLAEQEGFDVEVDGQGNVTKINKRFDPDDEKRKELESGLLDRSLKALKGELPVDPALEDSLSKQEQELRDRLSAQLGPGYETSTPGIEMLGEFFRSSEILREGARTGQLTLAEQLGITREQQDIYRRQSSQDTLRQSAIGDPLTFAGAFGQTARGYGQAQQPFIEHRRMQLQASMANAQSSNAMLGAGVGLIGALISDVDAKEDIVPIGRTESGLGIYEYTLKSTGERMIGVLSHEVEEILPHAVGTRMGYDVVDYSEVKDGGI